MLESSAFAIETLYFKEFFRCAKFLSHEHLNTIFIFSIISKMKKNHSKINFKSKNDFIRSRAIFGWPDPELRHTFS